MISGAAYDVAVVQGTDDGHVWNRTAVEADGVEVSGVIGVKDDVDAAVLVDNEGAKGTSRHRECPK